MSLLSSSSIARSQNRKEKRREKEVLENQKRLPSFMVRDGQRDERLGTGDRKREEEENEVHLSFRSLICSSIGSGFLWRRRRRERLRGSSLASNRETGHTLGLYLSVCMWMPSTGACVFYRRLESERCGNRIWGKSEGRARQNEETRSSSQYKWNDEKKKKGTWVPT